MKIRGGKESHYEEIRLLNESAVPHVNSISLEEIGSLAEQSKRFLVAESDENVMQGFFLVLDETASYSSPNYQFFKRRHPKFLYVDRIVIGPDYHRLGIGKKLYQEVIKELSGAYPVLTCEVNLHPPNPSSVAFHEKLGFEGVGEQETENGTKRVLLMERQL